jgi:apolipoprotein D and lipocalin family protein
MKKGILLVAVVGFAVCVARRSGASQLPPLRTVPHVDLASYAGLWYEIARYPNRFQRGCLDSRATYTLRQDGKVEVVNSCRDEHDGELRQAKGKAWPVDESNARLKVSFFWPFRGDYWIIELGKAYEYAVVGTPDRKYLWVLSRSPQMDDGLYEAIMERAKAQGFDPARMMRSKR